MFCKFVQIVSIATFLELYCTTQSDIFTTTDGSWRELNRQHVAGTYYETVNIEENKN